MKYKPNLKSVKNLVYGKNMGRDYKIRRSKNEVAVDILRVAMNGATKTHIIYDTKLNYIVVQKYLEMLIEKELIKQENGRFTTTAKGKTFQQMAIELKL